MGNLGSERQQCKDPPLEWGRPRHGPNAGAAARSRRYWYVDTLEYAAINRRFVCHYSTYTRAPREEWRPLTAILYRRRTINWKYRVNNPLPATFQDAYKSNIKQLYCFFLVVFSPVVFWLFPTTTHCYRLPQYYVCACTAFPAAATGTTTTVTCCGTSS